jgi:hypothetical protein
MDRVLNPPLHVLDGVARIALIPVPVELLGDGAELDDQVVERSSGTTSPRFSRHSRVSIASSLPMMIRASDPPMKWRRSSSIFVHAVDFMFSSKVLNW